MIFCCSRPPTSIRRIEVTFDSALGANGEIQSPLMRPANLTARGMFGFTSPTPIPPKSVPAIGSGVEGSLGIDPVPSTTFRVVSPPFTEVIESPKLGMGASARPSVRSLKTLTVCVVALTAMVPPVKTVSVVGLLFSRYIARGAGWAIAFEAKAVTNEAKRGSFISVSECRREQIGTVQRARYWG